MPPLAALQIARQVLTYARMHNIPITNIRLQKILYYIQGYTLRRKGHLAFDDDIILWAYGAVVPYVYFQYSTWGATPIQISDEDMLQPDPEMELMFEQIIKRISEKSLMSIVKMHLLEMPCTDTRSMTIIDPCLIWTYFKDNDPLGIDPVDNTAPIDIGTVLIKRR